MKRIIKNNYKIMIGFVLGILLSVTSVYAIEAYIESNKVTYKNHNKNNVQEAIDELYEKSGMHQDKWVDPILNGADPILKDPLIPVTIDNDGNVYYANLNSEWYNYSEKRWANAIILTDTAKEYKDDKEYKVGDHIIEDDIKGYFVWIPRYQYKVWNMGNYTSVPDGNTLTNKNYSTSTIQAFNNSRIIDVKFGSADKIPKMAEPTSVGVYYTHPAFTLGNKNLNGFWMAKFETGGTSENDMIVKPLTSSWRYQTVKVFFDAAKRFATNLNSHLIKNTEWGAIAYLSHSFYGIGTEVNVNNAKDYKTGYSAVPGVNKYTYPGEFALSTDDEKTQPWNTSVGYLASTTGNISGVYDMSGGTWEYMAACIDGMYQDSGFDAETLAQEMANGYIDKYSTSSTETSFNNRILGDATGEMGPFYNYFEGNGQSFTHNSWYGDGARFIETIYPWFGRGGYFYNGILNGQFYFNRMPGNADVNYGFRIVMSPI